MAPWVEEVQIVEFSPNCSFDTYQGDSSAALTESNKTRVKEIDGQQMMINNRDGSDEKYRTVRPRSRIREDPNSHRVSVCWHWMSHAPLSYRVEQK